MNFHPLIHEWFERSFTSPTEAQELAWTEINAGGDVLISAPTGSGKTLAAFLSCLGRLVQAALAGSLPGAIAAVYVSPHGSRPNGPRHKSPTERMVRIRRVHRATREVSVVEHSSTS